MLAEAWLWLIVATGPLLFGAVEPWSLLILQALTAAFPLICALTLPKSGEPFYRAPFVPSLLVILVLGVLQYLSPRPELGPQVGLISTADPIRTAAALVLYSCYGAVLVCAPRVLARAGAPRRLAWMMFLLGAAVACVGLLQTAQGNTMIYGLRPVAPDRNPFGPFYNRNHAAALMAMALPIGAGLAWVRVGAWRRAGSFEAKANLAAQTALVALPLACTAGGLYFIGSRGATLGLAGAVCLVLLGSRANTGFKKAVLAAALLAATALLFRPLSARIASWSAGAGPSVVTRVSMYKSGIELFKDSPLFGAGLGAFIPAFAPYRDTSIDGMVDHLHCDWGEAALESGIAGLAALILGFGWFLYKLDGSAPPDAEGRAVRAGALTAVAAAALHGFVEFALRIPGDAVFFLAAAALAAAGRPAAKAAPRAALRQALVPALAVCAFAAASVGQLAAVLPQVRQAGLPAASALNRISVPGPELPSDQRWRLAQALRQRAEAEPSRRVELLRDALAHVRAGLRYDAASPLGNRMLAAILSALGREGDARGYAFKGSFG